MLHMLNDSKEFSLTGKIQLLTHVTVHTLNFKQMKNDFSLQIYFQLLNVFLYLISGVVEYLSNGGVAENHKDFKELRYSECLTNFSCNGKNGNSEGSITHSFQLKSAYENDLMPYTNYTYDFKVGPCHQFHFLVKS